MSLGLDAITGLLTTADYPLAAGLLIAGALALVVAGDVRASKNDIDAITEVAALVVMSVVILPLLPEGPLGPALGIRPRELWLLVLLFSGMSFLGFLIPRCPLAPDAIPAPARGFRT